MENKNTIFDKMNNWIRSSVTLKLIVITILMLLLLIPASMIRSIIRERDALEEKAVEEVSSIWAGNQVINGPILTIPLAYAYEKEDGRIDVTRYLHILPENLNITGRVDPEILKRGIYEVIVYRSDLHIDGIFIIDPRIDPVNLKEVRYDEAFLTIGILDMRGIKDQVMINWDDRHLEVQPGSKIPDLIKSGITVDMPDIEQVINEPVSFEFALNLNGSKNLSFTPTGSSTQVSISSSWHSPSFQGNFLPDRREVSGKGFTAEWKILQLNRNYPQSWVDSGQAENLYGSVFGVDLIQPVDDYQQSMRSAKYAVMTIALTFLVFFLVEILKGRKIHPFQYSLVGLALCLFYILLVSISEQLNFIMAYILSATGIIAMITLYSLSIFSDRKHSILLGLILTGLYGFVFVILQLTDYSLLLGSLGLALILGATMYFTRNINWYRLSMKTE